MGRKKDQLPFYVFLNSLRYIFFSCIPNTKITMLLLFHPYSIAEIKLRSFVFLPDKDV